MVTSEPPHTSMIVRIGLSLGTAALLLLTACQAGDDQETGSVSHDEIMDAREGLDPDVVAALDDGNAAYREDDFEGALRHYEAAASIDDAVPAVWLGIYMANDALGNTEAADSALERVRTLAPESDLVHPDSIHP